MKLMEIIGRYENLEDAYNKFKILSNIKESISKDTDEYRNNVSISLHPLNDIEHDDFETIESLLSDGFVKSEIAPISKTLIDILECTERIIRVILNNNHIYSFYYTDDNYREYLEKVSDMVSRLKDANLYGIYHAYHVIIVEGFKSVGLKLNKSTESDLISILFNFEIVLIHEIEKIIDNLDVKESECDENSND